MGKNNIWRFFYMKKIFFYRKKDFKRTLKVKPFMGGMPFGGFLNDEDILESSWRPSCIKYRLGFFWKRDFL